MNRRRVLSAALTGGVSLLGGCTMFPNTSNRGSFWIVNRAHSPQTVTAEISRSDGKSVLSETYELSEANRGRESNVKETKLVRLRGTFHVDVSTDELSGDYEWEPAEGSEVLFAEIEETEIVFTFGSYEG